MKWTLVAGATWLALMWVVFSPDVGAEERARSADRAQAVAAEPWIRSGVPHPGGDQIYWVPTLTQAEAMASVTGRPIFMMGYVASWDGW